MRNPKRMRDLETLRLGKAEMARKGITVSFPSDRNGYKNSEETMKDLLKGTATVEKLSEYAYRAHSLESQAMYRIAAEYVPVVHVIANSLIALVAMREEELDLLRLKARGEE